MSKKDAYEELMWYENYNLLVDYYNKHHNIDFTKNYVVNSHNIGYWVIRQRHNYKVGLLTNDQIRLLERVGMKWDSERYTSWNDMYKILKEYKKKFGNVDVNPKTSFKGKNLGGWVHRQRQAYAGQQGYKITKEQIVLLNELGIDWTPYTTVKLNKEIANMDIYNSALNSRCNYVLRDLKLEGFNEINSKQAQKKIEKELIKRIWR